MVVAHTTVPAERTRIGQLLRRYGPQRLLPYLRIAAITLGVIAIVVGYKVYARVAAGPHAGDDAPPPASSSEAARRGRLG